LLLVDFVKPPYGRLVDFCAGCGVVGLGLLTRDARAHATLIELQPRLAALAQRNADDNGFATRATVFQTSVRSVEEPDFYERWDLVVCNPPYRRVADGPPSPNQEVAIANHELELTLAELADAMDLRVDPNGRVALVYPSGRAVELLAALEQRGLRPIRARFVHPRAHEPANRVLVEAHKGARGPLVVEPPLVIYDGGAYTDEARRILGES
jgi:tRNA1(Val) A37 N6-methylase TrmN6